VHQLKKPLSRKSEEEESKHSSHADSEDSPNQQQSGKLMRYRRSSPSFDGDDVASISDNSNEGTDIGEESQVSVVQRSDSHHTRFNVKQPGNLTERLTPYFEAFVPVFY